MTRAQFARAIQADEKWLENTARLLLGSPPGCSPAAARWMGLVRLLTREFALPLARAGELATAALRHPPGTRALPLVETADGSAALVLDLARYHSTLSTDLAAALHHTGPRRRGRPGTRAHARRHDPIRAAAAHGVDLSSLRANLRRTPAELLESLDEDATFLAALRPVARRRRANEVKRRVRRDR